jgi:hypothetical protein
METHARGVLENWGEAFQTGVASLGVFPEPDDSVGSVRRLEVKGVDCSAGLVCRQELIADYSLVLLGQYRSADELRFAQDAHDFNSPMVSGFTELGLVPRARLQQGDA